MTLDEGVAREGAGKGLDEEIKAPDEDLGNGGNIVNLQD
jgi:hypothetical protein